MRVRPLSTSTMWNSSGPSRSPGCFGPQWKVVYCVMSAPVAERTSSRSSANACAMVGTSFSMPAVTMCTRGGVVDNSALPSLVTVQVAPVSATRKFAPEMETSADRNLSRSSRRALSTIASIVSSACGARCSLLNISDTCSRVRCIAGQTMCEGVSPPS